jgi:hypothetical protein
MPSATMEFARRHPECESENAVDKGDSGDEEKDHAETQHSKGIVTPCK